MVAKPNPLVVILGPTASGKTALAIKVAKKFNGEVICADSWTVYKGFDIGTAKPTKAEQASIKHHLLDVAEPQDGFSVVEFKRLALDIINDIESRSRLPIIVGGAGLYVDSVIFDYTFLPAGEADARARLNQMSISQLMSDINVRSIDISGIDTRNKRRLIRLLESGGQRPAKSGLRAGSVLIGMDVEPLELKKRITDRVTTMLNSGLEQEVKNLSLRYGWEVEPMKGIGYREFKPYFAGDKSIEEVKEAIVASSLRLVKKQRTWFKRNKNIHWFDDDKKATDFLSNELNTYL